MNLTRLKDLYQQYEEKPLVWLAILLLVIFALHGKPVPSINEYVYLLRLKPDFLINDWTFSQPANEHWFFNTIFGIPAHFLSVEAIGWIGRLLVWTVCSLGLIKIGQTLGIRYWQTVASIVVWLDMGQGALTVEWIFGGFEAKTVAYCFLLFALAGFAVRSVTLPSIFLGLTFSFHPAVGLWAIGAVGVSLLLLRTGFPDLVKSAVLIILFASPMLIHLLLNTDSIKPASSADWELIVRSVFAHHFDFSHFNHRNMLWLILMLAFNVVATWKSENFAVRFFRNFQIVLGVFFAGGVLIYFCGAFSLLGYMPMRLFPLFTPLLFLYTAFYVIPRIESRTVMLAATVFVVSIIGVHDPSFNSIREIKKTVSSWRNQPDDLTQAYKWIAKNTPETSTLLNPPTSTEVWYYSERASVVAFWYPVYDRLGDWHSRIVDLTGNSIKIDQYTLTNIESAFNALSEEEIDRLGIKYNATHLVSKTAYSYPILFETETYKVYLLK